MQGKVKVVAKAKEKTCDKMHKSLDSREEEKTFTSWPGRETQLGRMCSMTIGKGCRWKCEASEECVLRRWKQYFEELMNI